MMIVCHRSAPSGLRSPLRFAMANHRFPRAISCRALCGRMQGFKERHERRGLCWTQIVSVGRHIAAALDHLPDELVSRKSHGNTIESRSPLSPGISEGMAVSALLGLKHERTLPLERGCAMYVSVGHWIAAPGVHVRTPRRELGQTSKRAERDRDHEHGDDCNRSALPALFPF